MIRGIIYKYTSPSGKVYIGQTINEKDRRKHFLIQKLSYGGIKIDTARAMYPVNQVFPGNPDPLLASDITDQLQRVNLN